MQKSASAISSTQPHPFTQHLFQWWAKHQRLHLPWKQTQDPYKIWLSEIILQQTRVEQGTPYYLKFVKAYPTVQELAAASSDEVMRLWEGLGYYSRARNMQAAAQFIVQELDGVFPNTHKAILQLKGVGPYTAAAIASFAFNLPHAVVDGNVYRVLSRYFGIETPIDTTKGKKEFAKLAQELLDIQQAGNFNQAIMDFGATHCVPKQPNCANCLMNKDCQAYLTNKVSELPIKSKKLVRKERFFTYLVITNKDNILLQKRVDKDIWRELYQFVLIERRHLLSKEQLLKHPLLFELFQGQTVEIGQVSKTYKQLLTHQKIHAQFIRIDLGEQDLFSLPEKENRHVVQQALLNNYAFPKIINNYLQDYWWNQPAQLSFDF